MGRTNNLGVIPMESSYCETTLHTVHKPNHARRIIATAGIIMMLVALVIGLSSGFVHSVPLGLLGAGFCLVYTACGGDRVRYTGDRFF